MSSDEVAIRVENLSKCYALYDAPRDRLKQFILPRLQRVVGSPPKNYYREFWALKGISFQVRKGETVGVVGRNGSGKSTLLQLVCGTLTPTSGHVETNGRIAALLELGSGFNPEFTGRENVYLNGGLLGLDHSLIESRFDDIAAFADIGDFLDQPIKTYSSGMLVRLAFAVLAFSDPDVLIVDEALAVGDAVFTQKCARYIRRFRDSGSLFFVSHNMQAVLDLCDRAIWLNHGAIQFEGDSIEVVREYSAHIHQLVTQDTQIKVTRAANDGKPKLRTRDKSPKEITFPYRVELFDFDFDAPYWGKGGATIEDVQILDPQKRPSKLLTDCGDIEIQVHCRALSLLRQPVVGFHIRNSRGVELISDNSYLALRDSPRLELAEGTAFIATFKFFLPFLAPGEYTLGAAIADGVPGSHTQHHRRDEALRFTVVSSHVIHGLLSMPLTECRIWLSSASVSP